VAVPGTFRIDGLVLADFIECCLEERLRIRNQCFQVKGKTGLTDLRAAGLNHGSGVKLRGKGMSF
jgi:hypothetical protein